MYFLTLGLHNAQHTKQQECTAISGNVPLDMCTLQRLRLESAFAQSDQSLLRHSLESPRIFQAERKESNQTVAVQADLRLLCGLTCPKVPQLKCCFELIQHKI